MGVIVGVLIVLAIATLINVFFFMNLQNTLKQCAPHNQRMRPGQVWLGLIPFFNYYWNFKVVAAVADSLASEYQQRNLQRTEERPGYQVGMAYCVLYCCALIQYTGIPALGQLAGLAGFICWIVYWVRTARFKRELEAHQFQFGQGNPNIYSFPHQFPGQPQQQPFRNEYNSQANMQQYSNQPPYHGENNPYMSQQNQNPPPQNPWANPSNPNPPQQ